MNKEKIRKQQEDLKDLFERRKVNDVLHSILLFIGLCMELIQVLGLVDF